MVPPKTPCPGLAATGVVRGMSNEAGGGGVDATPDAGSVIDEVVEVPVAAEAGALSTPVGCLPRISASAASAKRLDAAVTAETQATEAHKP